MSDRLVRMANGGVSRPLTLELMREMRRHVFTSWGIQPVEIDAPACQLEIYARLVAPWPAGRKLDWDGIPARMCAAVSADSMVWCSSEGDIMGVMADLMFK